MKLRELLKQASLNVALPEEANPEIASLATHTDDVVPNALFINLANNPNYAAKAWEKNAAFILSGNALPQGRVPQAISQLASVLYDAEIGTQLPNHRALVTGTNGKTSIAWYFYHLLASMELPAAIYGTLGVVGAEFDSAVNANHTMTTPDIPYNHQAMRALAKAGIEYVCLEASSHALDTRQQRLLGLLFKVAAFTNLSQDHLDYHGDMESYVQAKANIVEYLSPDGTMVVNLDDPHAEAFVKRAEEKGLAVLTYGISEAADLRIKNLDARATEVAVTYVSNGTEHDVVLPLAGDFQAHNIACVLCMLQALGIELEQAMKQLPQLVPPPGRMMEVAQHNDASIYVDYAHTPDALLTVLRSAKQSIKGTAGKLHVVFGAGGERDKAKRALMGEAACVADTIIITSDNPRSESPQAIAEAIMAGVHAQGKEAETVLDRRAAIARAAAHLQPGDVLIVAGKGHETGQEIDGDIVPFDDAKAITEMLEELTQLSLFTGKDIQEALGVEGVAPNMHFSAVAFNSQEITPGGLFIALTGGVRNGHEFVQDAFARGAAYALVSEPTGHPREIVVKDTLQAMQILAQHKRVAVNPKVIAVTGSVGKTSVKQALLDVLCHACPQQSVYATKGNLNNHIGVPLTLLRMPKHTNLAIIEMGMNHAGEIAALSAIATPDIGIITNTLDAHIGNLGSRENIAKAKAELFSNMKDGVAILPADSDHISLLKDAASGNEIHQFGEHKTALTKLVKYENGVVTALHNGEKITYALEGYPHDALNSLAVLAASVHAGAELGQVLAAMPHITRPEGRGNIMQLQLGKTAVMVIDDSYNASPASMKAALQNMAAYAGKRRIAVLGDMLELDDPEARHKALAEQLEHVEAVLLLGEHMHVLYKELQQKGGPASQHFTDHALLLEALKKQVQEGDVLLLKGSHGSHIYKIAEALQPPVRER